MPRSQQQHVTRASGAPRATLQARLRLMVGVLALALALLVIKTAAWWLTGSQGLLSDGIESLANVLTASFGIFSVWLAGRPPDESHPYGHGRIEFFAAGLEGALILAAGLAILREAIPSLSNPRPLTNLGAGGALAVLAALANGIAGAFLLRRGKRECSLMMVGEGWHLLSDTVTTGGVLAGLALVRATGIAWFDPLAACVVGVVVASAGVRLLRESAHRLMDQAEPQLLDGVARILAERRRPEWIDIHFLRARSSGETVHVDFHLALPRYWSLEEVHEVQDAVAWELLRGLGRRGEILVHTDPCQPRLCASCEVDACPVRAAAFVSRREWDVESLVAPSEQGAGRAGPKPGPSDESGGDAGASR